MPAGLTLTAQSLTSSAVHFRVNGVSLTVQRTIARLRLKKIFSGVFVQVTPPNHKNTAHSGTLCDLGVSEALFVREFTLDCTWACGKRQDAQARAPSSQALVARLKEHFAVTTVTRNCMASHENLGIRGIE